MNRALGVLVASAVLACGSSGGSGTRTSPPAPEPTATPPAPPPQQPESPAAGQGTTTPPPASTTTDPAAGMSAGVARGPWTFWSVEQGLTPRIDDVSADEAGNVYVAGREAVFAKKAKDAAFRRFDASNAGLTESCWFDDFSNVDQYIGVASPPGPHRMCPAISVAGSTPGKAVLGFRGVGTDQDKDAAWALRSGGADVVLFDGTALRRERHVLVAGPPGTVCEQHICNTVKPGCTGADCPCATKPDGTPDYATDANGLLICVQYSDSVFKAGRFKDRQIQRVVVNHRQGLGYGDAIFGGQHGSFSVLVANPEARGWDDTQYTKGDPAWADAKYVFEHQHPANTSPTTGALLTGETWAIAIDPRSGVPWFANQFRVTNMPGYATMKVPYLDPNVYEPWWGDMTGAPTSRSQAGYLSFWVDRTVADDMDATESLSFCGDGSLWAGSLFRGLARATVDPRTGAILGVSSVHLPPPYSDCVLAVACDPSDGSLWVGSEEGGILRYKNGAFTFGTTLLPTDAPTFAARAPVRSIQIDSWSTPRVVYIAHQTYKDSAGNVHPGGVSAYFGD